MGPALGLEMQVKYVPALIKSAVWFRAFNYGCHEIRGRLVGLHFPGKEPQGWTGLLNGLAALGEGMVLMTGQGGTGTMWHFTQSAEKSQNSHPEGDVRGTGTEQEVIRRVDEWGGEVRVCQGRCVCKGPEVGVAGWVGGGPALIGRLGPLSPPRSLQSLANSLLLRFIRSLEHSLLNTSFGGKNLTLQTHSIQTLAFKLGCDFTGLTLNSAALEPVPQVRGGQEMEGSRGLYPRTPPGASGLDSPLSPTNLVCPNSCELPLLYTGADAPHVNGGRRGGSVAPQGQCPLPALAGP